MPPMQARGLPGEMVRSIERTTSRFSVLLQSKTPCSAPIPVPSGHSLPWHTRGDRVRSLTQVRVQGTLRGQAIYLVL
jgi:hypothetical protein